MRYIPEERKLLAAGEYDFEVVAAKERTSTRGTSMIEVKLVVSNGRGDRTTVFDNLLSWNLGEFMAAIGEQVVYGEEAEVDPDDLVGRTGRLKLRVENYEGEERNKVAKYLPGPVTATRKVALNEFGEPKDNIPF
jgi:hypothetical protein